MSAPDRPAEHTDVGAYALGVLDAVEAERFEEHLAECDRCAAELESLTALPPLLAEHAFEGPPPEPSAGLLDRLLEETATERRTRRSRRLWLVAAVFALIVGGPLAAVAVTGGPGDEGHGRPVSAAREMYEHGEKISSVDPVTHARATVSLEKKAWGTHVALKLGNVTGPKECELIAVGRDGGRQTVTTWSVPRAGYGVSHAAAPLYAHGGAAFSRDEIARFEVRTLSGERLATVRV
ncbi:anti-sigma factor family protein [Streptomyces sp. NPDC048172]|uniref:anti-sigma factor family protein n=1 Tax=Streptomyces sp. NPDC048172 TaxID=3365505 RepID=UPI0037177A7F